MRRGYNLKHVRSVIRVLFCVIAALGLARASSAQRTGESGPQASVSSTSPAPSARPETYGTASTSLLQIPSAAFIASRPAGMQLVEAGSGYVHHEQVGGGAISFAPFNLPNGAQIESIDVYFEDSDPSENMDVHVYQFSGTTTLGLLQIGPTISSSGSAGLGFVSQPITPFPVDNTNQYMVYINTGLSTTLAYRAVAIRYRLQVSPDPAIATFGDVPIGHPQHRFVEALVAAGITAGCGSGNYCPDQPLTRGQMAVFLSVALGLHWPN
jgi:S-layer family protein